MDLVEDWVRSSRRRVLRMTCLVILLYADSPSEVAHGHEDFGPSLSNFSLRPHFATEDASPAMGLSHSSCA